MELGEPGKVLFTETFVLGFKELKSTSVGILIDSATASAVVLNLVQGVFSLLQ